MFSHETMGSLCSLIASLFGWAASQSVMDCRISIHMPSGTQWQASYTSMARMRLQSQNALGMDK